MNTENEVQLPELGAIGLLRFVWRQLTSMRTALVLLMMVGLAAIPGSLIPQRTTNPMAVSDYFRNSPTLAEWYDRFSLFDVYGSPWFSAIYILLFISLIGCVLPRTFEHYKALRSLPPATPKNLSRLEHFHHFESENALEKAEAWFKKNRFRVRREEQSLSTRRAISVKAATFYFTSH